MLSSQLFSYLTNYLRYNHDMNISFHHIAITVQNLIESVRWYQDIFGFKKTHEYSKDDMTIVLLQKDSVRIELFAFRSETTALPEYRKELMKDLRTEGTKHICIEVENLEKMIKKLQSRGEEPLGKPDEIFFGGRNLFVKDPCGNLIELFQS